MLTAAASLLALLSAEHPGLYLAGSSESGLDQSHSSLGFGSMLWAEVEEDLDEEGDEEGEDGEEQECLFVADDGHTSIQPEPQRALRPSPATQPLPERALEPESPPPRA